MSNGTRYSTLDHETSDQLGENTLQRIPDWIKPGSVGLVVLAILVLAWLIFKTSDDDQIPSMADVEHSPTESVKADAIDDAILEPAIHVQPLVEMGVIPETNELTGTIKPDSEPLPEQVDQLRIELADYDSMQDTWQKQQDVLITDLQDRLIGQARKIEQLEVRLNNQSKPKPKSKPKRVRTSVSKAPFALINIDQWGDDTYAILRHEGRLYEKTIGQTISGWRVIAINRDNNIVSVQDKSGRRRELAITPTLPQ